MLRPAILIVLALGATGCQGPSSSTNFFAPFGESRVPPPATGSVKAGGAYYQPPSAPPQGLGQTSPAAQRATDLSPGALTPQDKRSNTGNTVQLAQNRQEGKGGGSASPRDSIVARLQGMPVNDATKFAEPRQLKTPANVVEISQLPPPQTTSTWAYDANSVNRASYSVDDRSAVESSAWRSKSDRNDTGG